MGKDGGFLTAKAISNRIKAKGLQKLRWYCQMCEKQCRDENGFKCHCASDGHQRQMMLFAENTQSYLTSHSEQFHSDFVKLLSGRYGTRRVFANQVYQEFISDRNHLHMNATVWMSLSAYVKYLGKEGICEVDETEKGWYIKWIDRSAATLARQEAVLKKERAEKTEDERERKLLNEQITKAQAGSAAIEEQYTDLKRESNDQPIKLQLGASLFKPTVKKFEPKKINALAAASKKSASVSKSLGSAVPFKPEVVKPLSAMERVIHQDQLKRKRFGKDRDDSLAQDKRSRY
ncbi:hypothetical protein BATDEDRAFT_36990 [Batrachochytrium dendrobatidis JAM81]|uniref:DNA/RNA-binding protein Kin17 WH-like domain-containing protein n=2 Tax=Batrachochytrium dendrobatidis TaxID=109871 RepID=F4P2Y9_BATDJ|nr:uncharacterized protein BATDEDRAFT_36990 [Batrachochytrium dendrobatidis JAM81]EGF80520.1 hypothetical protein BATDEDRAFT_36990 [Batrachochytrium dendrobatidis JAM81]KAJ8326265.1 hypothetical protein O5D80_005029 [Batrachochytrium dendrobatidis]KAK5665950.1 hypothetical protein QVD99_007574 [Batrachochytrium dendrobatidis]OAJ40897.1 hypothetical protein BDEG_24579 [Batrachochytrium dendrobatidis JEL423]|eukprot:XP_006679148.1 hypothetical protein BATDEDRAFT_36990 [Batrachochytrium dendrobatidis JAM81]